MKLEYNISTTVYDDDTTYWNMKHNQEIVRKSPDTSNVVGVAGMRLRITLH